MTPEFSAGLSAVCIVAAVTAAVLSLCALLDAHDARDEARKARDEARGMADAAVAARVVSEAAADASTENAERAYRAAGRALKAAELVIMPKAEADPLQADTVEPLPEEPPPAGPKRRGRAAVIRALFDRQNVAERHYQEIGGEG